MDIQIRKERHRGCGYRKPCARYLVCDGVAAPCGKLPLPLCTCPTCGAGIKPSRGWTWIDVPDLFMGRRCQDKDCHGECPLFDPARIGRAGLLWVGEKYYDTPDAFLREADELGVSRRIHHIPKDFKLGQTWVLLAHRNCVDDGKPGIFSIMRPKAIEYIVKGTETEEELFRLQEQGCTLVRVERIGEQKEFSNVETTETCGP